VAGAGQVQIPPRDAGFGIISDVDDTVLQTGATSLGSMLRVTLLQNAHTRLPFDGVSAFYQALHAGPDRTGANPIFYVSSSPWNLYDFLVDFFAIQSLPAGTLFLRDLGLEADRFLQSSHADHKLTQIERVLHAYPDLPFVLVGDSGQRDPEIYLDTVREFPGRVRAVYIRNVTAARRAAEVECIAGQVRALGADFLLVTHTAAAAEHAAANGLIHPAAVDEVRAGTTPAIDTMGEVVRDRR
jgi:phosphatidate phosphatase APP1